MKKTIITAVTACAMAASCTMADKTVEFPLVEACNTSMLSIEKVELTDTATFVTARSFNRPGWWVRWVGDTHLMADGKRYGLKGAEGIKIDDYLYMPADGDSVYTLIFKPLPKNTKKFDIIEGDVEGRFYIAGIDLTGRKMDAYPKTFPKELRKTPTDTEFPEPVMKVGEATIRLHLKGYRKDMYRSMEMHVNHFIGDNDAITIEDIRADGECTVSFPVSCIAEVRLSREDYRSVGQRFFVAPDEVTDVYIDLVQDNWNMPRINEDYTLPPEKDITYFRTTGSYASLNNSFRWTQWCKLNLFAGEELTDYRKSGQEYVDGIIRAYHEHCDSLKAENLPPLGERFSRLMLQNDVLNALGNPRYFYEHNYRVEKDLWNRNDVLDYDFDLPTDEQVAEALSIIDFNDPGFWFMTWYANKGWTKCSRLAGVTEGLVPEFETAVLMNEKAKNGGLGTEDLDSLRRTCDPIFEDICLGTLKRTEAALAAGSSLLQETPDVPLEKLFEAIIAPHKGKVVLVDFWNTWCGPCRSAIAANEPLKSDRFKGKDIVWIYIANETSPLGKYMEMITGIEGLHYRLDKEQWKQLTALDFNLDGIPSYVLVGKDGTAGLRNDLRNHNLMVSTLEAALQK